jgi:hypothetical protein
VSHSVSDLVEAIEEYLRVHNDEPETLRVDRDHRLILAKI